MKLKQLITLALAASLSIATSGIASASTPSMVLSTSDVVSAIEDVTGLQLDSELIASAVNVKTVEIADNLTVSATDASPGQVTQHVEMDVMYAGAQSTHVSDSTQILDGNSDGITGAVAANENGFSIYTVIMSPYSPNEYSYKLHLPREVKVENFQGGYTFDGHDFSAVITAPWAVDAIGHKLNTWYSFQDSTLTQHVDLNVPNIVFPVVADPRWSYSFRQGLVNVNTTQAWNEMQDRFDYFFPVTGAPRSFPKVGQTLPLKVAPLNVLEGSPLVWNFECKMGPIDNHNGLYGWYFYATDNHIDGFGSWIRFRLMNSSSGPQLAVDAYIVNDFLNAPFGMFNDQYATQAKANWSLFAYRLDLN